MTATSHRATIVMYHYVRRVAGTRFSRLPALDVGAFAGQVDYIQRHYSPIAIADLVGAADGSRTLPPRPIVLTFDDGYREHYGEVFPLLRARGIPGTFFPASASLVDRRVLDVNKIQFVVAAGPVTDIVTTIEDAVEGASDRVDVRAVAAYRADGWKPVRYDTPDVSYVKYMLQGALPSDLRGALVDELFARFVSDDQRAFAEDLYFSASEGREMAAAGMTIGCHADRHVTLTSLTRDEQAHEIDGALRVLDAIGRPREPLFFSYAKGAFNTDSIDLLRARRCLVAVTNRPEIATLSSDALLSLPRLDANHLPTDALAPPNEWTVKA
jgi:peptidoglycan/xylan/chitin deacetylase (PgdA/CDA1 family)